MRDAEWRRPPGSRAGGGHDRRRGRWQGVPRGGWGGLEGGDFDLAPAAGTHHLVASLGGKGGAGFARVRHRVLNCRMPACLESGRQASWFKKKWGKFCRKITNVFQSLPGGRCTREALGRTSEGHSERSIQNSNCLCDEDVAGGGGGAVVNGFSFFFGKFRERERTPAEAEAPVVQLVRWCTRSSVYLFGLVLIFFRRHLPLALSTFMSPKFKSRESVLRKTLFWLLEITCPMCLAASIFLSVMKEGLLAMAWPISLADWASP